VEVEARKEPVTAKVSPFAVLDYVLEEILGLPSVTDVLIFPKDVMEVLGVPTLDKVFEDFRAKAIERARREAV